MAEFRNLILNSVAISGTIALASISVVNESFYLFTVEMSQKPGVEVWNLMPYKVSLFTMLFIYDDNDLYNQPFELHHPPPYDDYQDCPPCQY